MTKMQQYDVIIIGSGVAGLTLALRLNDKLKIAIITKDTMQNSCSSYAQGGIAACLAINDSLELHISDTLVAGRGLSDRINSTKIINSAPEIINWLLSIGVPFTPSSTCEDQELFPYHLCLEGGHSRRRVIHYKDTTGKKLIEVLSKYILERNNISIFEYCTAMKLLTSEDKCIGVKFWDENKNTFLNILARVTVLASGGYSSIFANSTNPDIITGNGISMAWDSGCRLANLEFIQFHPTSLYNNTGSKFLISEAVRGEGAYLCLSNGFRFMEEYHENKELAPRDIVARSIYKQMEDKHLDHVYLDLRHMDSEFIVKHFPNIYRVCKSLNINLPYDMIPVVPAAHYTCGGIIVDVNGKTDLNGLYAIGETAHTGLHGANRLASNSLLECLVMGSNAAKMISEENFDLNLSLFSSIELTENYRSCSLVIDNNIFKKISFKIWQTLGLIRNQTNLEELLDLTNEYLFSLAKGNIYHANDPKAFNCYNIVNLVKLITISALSRTESRGVHYRIDYPEIDYLQEKDTILLNKTRKI